MASDYERWALEVPGVSWARCHPARRGPGTVDVVVTSDGGLPSDVTLAAVQARLDANRPVACPDCLALSPVPLAVDVAAGIRPENGKTIAALRPGAETALERLFAAILPGEAALVSRMLAAIVDVPGIADARIVSPAANTIPEALRWPRLGVLLLEGL
jgi:uncharacterized phage protein gp47/JayE